MNEGTEDMAHENVLVIIAVIMIVLVCGWMMVLS